jgi:preprotein translocase subunit SecE
MNKQSKEKLKQILTVIGWVIIAVAVIALIGFIINSGVF